MGGSDFTDKFPQHPLGHIVVGNNALPQGADGNDVAGVRPSIFCASVPTFNSLPVFLFNCNNGRLPQDNALAFYINQNRSSTQIDTNISRDAHFDHTPDQS